MLHNKNLLVVNTGIRSKLPLFQNLRNLGLKVICLNHEVNWAASYVSEWIIADPSSIDSLSAIDEYLESHPNQDIDGALTFDDRSVLLTAAITEKLGLKGIPLQIAKWVKNKLAFRQFSEKNAIPTPRFSLLETEPVFEKSKLRYPLVVKPDIGVGSAFVKKVVTPAELKETIDTFKVAHSTPKMTLYVEEFIKGQEVDIDVLIQNGEIKFMAISDNFPSTGDYFVERGGQIPSRLPSEHQEALCQMVHHSLNQIGIMDGCLHYEAISSDEGSFPVEINLRLGGAEISAFQQVVWGRNMVEDAVRIALGLPIKTSDRNDKPKKVAMSTNFVPTHSGTISQIHRDSKLPTRTYFEELELHYEVGDEVGVPPDCFKNLGWLVASGETYEEAERHLRSLEQLVKIEIS